MHEHLVHICLCNWNSKMDIPASDSLPNPTKTGFLQKLTGRGWLYSGSWKSRYCVLSGSKFYFYESQQSNGSEKTSGVLNLDYYDVCEEIASKDKKCPHVFFIGTSVRGFFDNRQQFAAESADDMQSWIRTIQSAIAEARLSRRKKSGRKQRHLADEKSPNISNSSQESGGTSTACLVNATKDRAKGPQGRRLPSQRKSLMPTSRSPEGLDIRQRSISLSSPHRSDPIDEEDNTLAPNDSKWLSLSMEDVDQRDKKEGMENQRSSSVFDISQNSENIPTSNAMPQKPTHKKGLRTGNLLGQHAALTKELEMRLKVGRPPGGRRLQSETDEEEGKEDGVDGRKIERLTSQVDEAKEALVALEEKVSQLTRKVEKTKEEATSQVGDVLLQVTVTLKEAERINEECKRALIEANKAKNEYQTLAKECKETLAKLNKDSEPLENGA